MSSKASSSIEERSTYQKTRHSALRLSEFTTTYLLRDTQGSGRRLSWYHTITGGQGWANSLRSTWGRATLVGALNPYGVDLKVFSNPTKSLRGLDRLSLVTTSSAFPRLTATTRSNSWQTDTENWCTWYPAATRLMPEGQQTSSFGSTSACMDCPERSSPTEDRSSLQTYSVPF